MLGRRAHLARARQRPDPQREFGRRTSRTSITLGLKVTNRDGKQVAGSPNDIAITPEQVAGAVVNALDQPADVSIYDVVIHPTEQAW
ncbi:hypothetical protein ACIBG4_32205 [Nonomuraea sp. NPDC050383]|uniref:hypothetical protein n=1 Tax=Nonomuraea sp. NPDC050383 TaxID=3364362 RepID=UPI0037A6A7AB